jgi:predicted lipoprotein with Yx(FWY)xxD motif
VKRSTVLSAATLALASALAGCGSSGNSSSSAAAPSTASSSKTTTAAASNNPGTTAEPVALISTKHAKLGTILAYGPKKLTVYLFEADKGPASSCTGACAKAWPPVTGTGKAAGGALASRMGTIKRPDGTTQVTYHGHPLYLFVRDKDDGDAYGQAVHAFGADWYTLNPGGSKVDKS